MGRDIARGLEAVPIPWVDTTYAHHDSSNDNYASSGLICDSEPFSARRGNTTTTTASTGRRVRQRLNSIGMRTSDFTYIASCVEGPGEIDLSVWQDGEFACAAKEVIWDYAQQTTKSLCWRCCIDNGHALLFPILLASSPPRCKRLVAGIRYEQQ